MCTWTPFPVKIHTHGIWPVNVWRILQGGLCVYKCMDAPPCKNILTLCTVRMEYLTGRTVCERALTCTEVSEAIAPASRVTPWPQPAPAAPTARVSVPVRHVIRVLWCVSCNEALAHPPLRCCRRSRFACPRYRQHFRYHDTRTALPVRYLYTTLYYSVL